MTDGQVYCSASQIGQGYLQSQSEALLLFPDAVRPRQHAGQRRLLSECCARQGRRKAIFRFRRPRVGFIVESFFQMSHSKWFIAETLWNENKKIGKSDSWCKERNEKAVRTTEGDTWLINNSALVVWDDLFCIYIVGKCTHYTFIEFRHSFDVATVVSSTRGWKTSLPKKTSYLKDANVNYLQSRSSA